MSFTSLDFLLFFLIVFIIYFIVPNRLKCLWLLAASYLFYLSWNPKYIILLLATTAITYIGGLLIERANKKDLCQTKKMLVFLCFFVNLLILFLFKYYNFFSSELITIFSLFHIHLHIPSYDYLLPIGISFYTFKALSYIIDVYRGDTVAEKSLVKYSLFVSFFPQLVAGPIDKAKDLLPQFDEVHSFEYQRVKSGFLLMFWGLIKKVVIADRLGQLVNTVYSAPNSYSGFEIVIASLFFSFEIYCDFSGYSDISIGAAEVLGFNVAKNFERPYFSKSIKEFWRRWHISLGAWFKDYLYIPLGGNRCSKLRNYFNIMVVFILCGLWHGAAVNFLIWGIIHGILQVLGDLLKPVRKAVIKVFKLKTDVFSHKLFQVLFTFSLVNFAWIFFRASSFKSALTLISNMSYFNPWIFFDGSIYKLGLDASQLTISILGVIFILIESLLERNMNLRYELSKQNIIFRWSIYILAIIIFLIFGIYGPGFNPQQFIYARF